MVLWRHVVFMVTCFAVAPMPLRALRVEDDASVGGNGSGGGRRDVLDEHGEEDDDGGNAGGPGSGPVRDLVHTGLENGVLGLVDNVCRTLGLDSGAL